MKFFETKKQDAYTVIIGCGRLGANLANTLSNEGENVLIMDSNSSPHVLLHALPGTLLPQPH